MAAESASMLGAPCDYPAAGSLRTPAAATVAEIAIFGTGTARLFNTVVNSNNAQNVGGGISNNGNLTVVSGIIGFNTANGGGGLFNNVGTASLTSTDVVHNTARTSGGGGIDNAVTGRLTAKNSNIQFNTGLPNGGGIQNQGILQVLNSRLSDNRAAAGGGGGGLAADSRPGERRHLPPPMSCITPPPTAAVSATPALAT
jgi:hypothetical protein